MNKYKFSDLMDISVASRVQSASIVEVKNSKKAIFIQPKDIDVEKGVILNICDLPIVNVSEKTDYLQEGDVVFSIKGSFKAFYVDKVVSNLKAIASSSCVVIKSCKSISSEYLVEYLNSEKFQFILKQNSIGSTIPSVSISTLNNMTIKVPAVESQLKAVNILKDYRDLLNLKEKQLDLLKQQRTSVRHKLIDF